VVKVVSATTITLGVPPRVKIGQELPVAGYLTGKYGEPLSGQTLDFFVNGEKDIDSSVVTDSKGYFTWSGKFTEPGKYILQVTFPGAQYYLASTAEADFRVLAPAVITLKAGDTTLNKPLKISGRLAEQKTDIPLPGRSLVVTIDGAAQETPPVTDSSGKFTSSYTFSATGTHKLTVRYPGDEDYFEVAVAADVNVAAASGFSTWVLVFVVVGLAAAGFGGWMLYKWLKNRPIHQAGADFSAANEPAETDPALPWRQAGPGLSLEIGLPQIVPPLPDVWGRGEELVISFRLAGNNGVGISAALEVTVNAGAAARLLTDGEGKAELRHTFAGKGRYELAAKYQDGPDKNASAGRTVRIVDYREEIVALFNDLVEQFRAAGIRINDEYTPRKIQYLVAAANAGVPEKALEDATYCFEETDYSLHAINRRHYEMMYLAWKEIKEHGFQPAARA
jgi:hypothetical protein